MENINRKASADSPEVFYDRQNCKLKIMGNSYPENCSLIYDPILDFINHYESDNHILNFYFHFNLINSTSTVYMAKIITAISKLTLNGTSTLVKWCYDEHDEEMLDLGKKLSSIANIPVEYVKIKDDVEDDSLENYLS